MELPAFQYYAPKSPDEVVALLTEHAGDVDIVAGGTDLLPNYKNRLNNKGHVISLAAVTGLTERSTTRLGALTRLVEIEQDEALAGSLPALVEAAAAISSPPLRNHGTVGGNIMLDTRCYFFNQSLLWRKSKHYCLKADGDNCLVVPSSVDKCYATYSGELAAPLIAFGAELELLGPDGLRTVSLEEFFTDDGIVRFGEKSDAEFLVGVRIPEEAQGLKSAYAKLRIRDSIDFPSLGICVAYRLGEDGTLADLRVGTTALRSRPERHDSVTDIFIGQTPSPELAAAIGEVIRKDVAAYRNVPLDPKYRKKMAAVFVRRCLARLDAVWTE
jgi:4-hydroxybenzoyl-CoA reductase subunit beta